MKVYRKHKTQKRYWDFENQIWVPRTFIAVGSLIIDYKGREISYVTK